MACRNGFMGSQAPGFCLHPMPAASNGLWQQGQDPTASGRPWLGHLPTPHPPAPGTKSKERRWASHLWNRVLFGGGGKGWPPLAFSRIIENCGPSPVKTTHMPIPCPAASQKPLCLLP